MTVDGVPNVRVCVEPVRAGDARRARRTSAARSSATCSAIVDKVGGPFTPVGFYYRTMIRPRRAWPLYERFLRNMAGLGRVDPHARRTRRFDAEHRRVDVLVIGGGSSGREAAREAAARGLRPARRRAARAARATIRGVEILCPARALGIYEGGLVPVETANLLLPLPGRARSSSRPARSSSRSSFPGNDLVGVMLPQGVRRMVRRLVTPARDEGDRDRERRRRPRRRPDSPECRHRGRPRRRPAPRAAAVARGRGQAREAAAGRGRRPRQSTATCSSCPA